MPFFRFLLLRGRSNIELKGVGGIDFSVLSSLAGVADADTDTDTDAESEFEIEFEFESDADVGVVLVEDIVPVGDSVALPLPPEAPPIVGKTKKLGEEKKKKHFEVYTIHILRAQQRQNTTARTKERPTTVKVEGLTFKRPNHSVC